MVGRVAILALLAATGAGAAGAQDLKPGVYLCTLEQEAGIGKSHMENSGPPEAFIDKAPKLKFRIEILRGPGFTIIERPYDGPDASQYEWHTPNAILHSAYRGDGFDFVAAEDLGFLRMWQNAETGRTMFWQSGFAYAGGEDPSIRTHSGTCMPDKK